MHGLLLLVRIRGCSSNTFPHSHWKKKEARASKPTLSGVTSPLSVGCHKAATSGRFSASDMPALGGRVVTTGLLCGWSGS